MTKAFNSMSEENRAGRYCAKRCGDGSLHEDPLAVNGDRTYLVLAKPNVIMNDIRLRGLAVAGTWASWHFRPNARFQPPRSLLGTTVSARQHAY